MNQTPAPVPEGHVCPDPLTQIVTAEQLADRLGVGASNIREHLRAGTGRDWLPRPAARIGKSHVWRVADLEGIEARRAALGLHGRRRPTEAAPDSAPGADDGWWTGPQ